MFVRSNGWSWRGTFSVLCALFAPACADSTPDSTPLLNRSLAQEDEGSQLATSWVGTFCGDPTSADDVESDASWSCIGDQISHVLVMSSNDILVSRVDEALRSEREEWWHSWTLRLYFDQINPQYSLLSPVATASLHARNMGVAEIGSARYAFAYVPKQDLWFGRDGSGTPYGFADYPVPIFKGVIDTFQRDTFRSDCVSVWAYEPEWATHVPPPGSLCAN